MEEESKEKDLVVQEEIKEEVVNPRKITKKDVILILIITLIYGIVSFINLGTFKNPQTFWRTEYAGDEVVFKIAKGKSDISNFRFYSGVDYGDFSLYLSYDGENYSTALTLSEEKVFAWRDFRISGDGTYIKLIANRENVYLGEIAVYDNENNKLELVPVSENSNLIIDEQDTVPEEISYLNSTYFDEIYFARTAYEHQHNLPVYEWTHPPLGKLLMIIPMLFGGMTTFAYRLMGNIAGILMIPAIYVFAKKLFKKSKYGVLAAIIMAADGMHFVQSRLGTADGFLVLFIILEFLFMYNYIVGDGDPLKKRLRNLFFSGLFMGLAIATKWSGVFAAIALAIIFLGNLSIRIFIKKEKWTKSHTLTILWCFFSFVLIPLIIYLLSYIPFYKLGYINNVGDFMKWQDSMYHYHHDLKAEHPYSSMWYTWPISQKSVLYWVGTTNSGSITRIALLGNPAIWWFSIPCMIYILIAAIYNTFKKKDFKLWLLIIPIITMMSAYFGVPRIMFLYHYFPVLPFVMLAIVATIKKISELLKTDIFIYLFAGIAIFTFIKFYPIYSGFPTTAKYIADLQWLKTWIW